MSDADRRKWDQRYRDGAFNQQNPVTLLQQWLPRLPRGHALDVACGVGRNALLLADTGYRVDAIDISGEGLRRARSRADQLGLAVNWIEHDLEQPFDFAPDYDLVVVTWYVNLPLIGRLADCLAPGGCLLSEQHLLTTESVIGPQNPAFRVAPGALRNSLATLEILHDDESHRSTPDGERLASAQIVARRPG
ncbi:MAG: class I SAM-dependent methyltransferase [Gammaproteobacteria bacterium]|nr:class I SAM-dependent methyltransferase [Gammaproteobacteria bacterium]